MRCERSISKKDLAVSVWKEKVKPPLPSGNGTERMRTASVGSASDAIATPANHINATSAGSGFRRVHSQESTAETKAVATGYAARARRRSPATDATLKNQRPNTRHRLGRRATRREEFARLVRKQAIGRAPPVTCASRTMTLAFGCVAGRLAKTEPRNATTASNPLPCSVRRHGRGSGSKHVAAGHASVRSWSKCARKSRPRSSNAMGPTRNYASHRPGPALRRNGRAQMTASARGRKTAAMPATMKSASAQLTRGDAFQGLRKKRKQEQSGSRDADTQAYRRQPPGWITNALLAKPPSRAPFEMGK